MNLVWWWCGASDCTLCGRLGSGYFRVSRAGIEIRQSRVEDYLDKFTGLERGGRYL